MKPSCPSQRHLSQRRPSQSEYSAVILAGGEARRMGGRDKGLVPFKGKPLVYWVNRAIPASCDDIIISCNRNHESYRQYADRVVSDCCNTNEEQAAQHLGPLAGIAAGLRQARHSHVLVTPCDNPYLEASTLSEFILNASWQKSIVNVVAIDGHHEPLHLFLHRSRLESLERALVAGQLKVRAWLQQEKIKVYNASAYRAQFVNINYFEELESSQRCLS